VRARFLTSLLSSNHVVEYRKDYQKSTGVFNEEYIKTMGGCKAKKMKDL